MATPTKSMCVVTIGHMTLLMQADKGMALLALMQHAVECKTGYAWPETYAVGEQPRIELCMVKPGQIRVPEDAVDAMPARRSSPRLLK